MVTVCAVRPRDRSCAMQKVRRARRRCADDPRRVRVRGRVRPAARRAASTRWAASGRRGRCRPCCSPRRRSRTGRRSATTRAESRPGTFSNRRICAAPGRRHVRRRAAAQPVRRVHRGCRSPIRPIPTSTIWSSASPGWYVLPIVVISLLGGLSQGVLCVYASGLDLEGLAPRLKRTQTTIITAAVAIALLYRRVCSCSTPSSRSPR